MSRRPNRPLKNKSFLFFVIPDLIRNPGAGVVRRLFGPPPGHPWIPAFAGMTTTGDFLNGLLTICHAAFHFS